MTPPPSAPRCAEVTLPTVQVTCIHNPPFTSFMSVGRLAESPWIVLQCTRQVAFNRSHREPLLIARTSAAVHGDRLGLNATTRGHSVVGRGHTFATHIEIGTVSLSARIDPFRFQVGGRKL